MSTSGCVFCDILEGRAEASFVYRDERCAVFMDIQPVNPGHVLVVPSTHAADLDEVDPDEWARVGELARRVAGSMRGRMGIDAVNLILADGEAAGQEVFHTHLHVIPRRSGDGFGFRFPPEYRVLPDRARLQERADAIRAALLEHTG